MCFLSFTLADMISSCVLSINKVGMWCLLENVLDLQCSLQIGVSNRKNLLYVIIAVLYMCDRCFFESLGLFWQLNSGGFP